MERKKNTDPDYNAVQDKWKEKQDRLLSQEEGQAKREQDQIMLKAAYRELFKSPSGKIVLADLEKEFRYSKTCFHADSRQTDYFLGKQSGIIYIHEKIKGRE